MIKITSSFLLFMLTFSPRIRAITLGPFIVFKDKAIRGNVVTNAHEMVHFFQQLEMLFVPMWVLYILFYFIGRLQGKNHAHAYRDNPFERESYETEGNPEYVITRKMFGWTRYV